QGDDADQRNLPQDVCEIARLQEDARAVRRRGADDDRQNEDHGQRRQAFELAENYRHQARGSAGGRVWVAAGMMVSGVASLASYIAVCRPSLSTRMRSQQRRNSDNSELARITPLPAAASASMTA